MSTYHDAVPPAWAWRSGCSPECVDTGPAGALPPPGTPPKGGRPVGAPAGVGKASGEDCSVAASSLIRWGGSAAVLGGMSTAFVGEFFPSHRSDSRGKWTARP